ncbi:MAG TPA: Abi-alpha family protein [Thermoleophilaceae bacterium]|nr:Abi-alpha family protein [Thermoleophilaceae bacterium]
MDPEPNRRDDEELLRATPALARMAALAWLRGLRWGAEASAKAYVRLLRAAAAGENPATAVQEMGGDLRRYARELLGIADQMEEEAVAADANGTSAEALRRRGEELLRMSADVHYEEDGHPAFARILEQLAPDEARILRLLAAGGPQPAVDVRTGGPLGVGVVATELVAPGLTMIGAEAGCMRIDRLHAYLDNLNRLGLIWFSREALTDQARYQVLEAQPEVVEPLAKAGRGARTIRRSIHLTPFGTHFCELCIPATTAEFEALRQ